jgi:hypothetical protein
MGELRRRIAALSPRAILVLGWCLFVVHAYPGLMAPDSFVQLQEARSSAFGDPALMTAIWWLFDRVVAGPFPMLALQSLAFVTGAYLVVRRLVQPRAAAVCAVVVLLLPPVAAGMAVVSAHALLAGMMLLGAGLLLDRRAGYMLAGVGVLGLAAGIRYHAAFATLPMMVMVLARWPTHLKWWQRYGLALLLWCSMTTMGLLINDWLPHQGAFVRGFPDDVTGTFAGVLGLTGDAQPIVTRESQSTELLRAAEIQQAYGWLQGATSRAVGALSQTIMFRPWLYLVLALALLVKDRRILELRTLLASGIALELSLVYHATDSDWRESHWLITCTLLASAIVIARRFRPAGANPGEARDRGN